MHTKKITFFFFGCFQLFSYTFQSPEPSIYLFNIMITFISSFEINYAMLKSVIVFDEVLDLDLLP